MVQGWKTGVLVLALLALTGGVARSAEPDAATAARLSELLNAGPCQPLATYSIRLRCEWRGPIVVEPDGDHYRAAVPEAVVILGDDRRIALGTMLVALRPESGDAWSFAFALPSPLRLTDKAGTPEMDAAFASVTVQGVWRPAAAGVTDLRAVASGLRLTAPTDSHAVSLANLSLTGLLAEGRDGRWSGPLALVLNGLAIPAGDGDDLIRLGTASLGDRCSRTARPNQEKGAETQGSRGEVSRHDVGARPPCHHPQQRSRSHPPFHSGECRPWGHAGDRRPCVLSWAGGLPPRSACCRQNGGAYPPQVDTSGVRPFEAMGAWHLSWVPPRAHRHLPQRVRLSIQPPILSPRLLRDHPRHRRRPCSNVLLGHYRPKQSPDRPNHEAETTTKKKGNSGYVARAKRGVTGLNGFPGASRQATHSELSGRSLSSLPR